MTLAEARNILVIRLDAIGDMVLTTPFLRELRKNNSGAWITLVVSPTTLNLFETCPYIDEVLTFKAEHTGLLITLKRHWDMLGFARRHFWRRRFDLALSPRWDLDIYFTAILAYFSGARQRVGYTEMTTERKSHDNHGCDLLYTQVLTETKSTHELQRNLDVLRLIGGEVTDAEQEVWTSAEDELFAEEMLCRNGIGPDDVLVALGPRSGNSPLKRWPLENFLELARRLQAEHGCRLLIVGGPGDEQAGAAFTEAFGSRAVSIAGGATLRQTAALLKRCHLYVGNDSGPTHLAAACGIPTVALFGASCHHRFIPWGARAASLVRMLPCSPCLVPGPIDSCAQCLYEEPLCMEGISVREVEMAIRDKLTGIRMIGTPEAALH